MDIIIHHIMFVRKMQIVKLPIDKNAINLQSVYGVI